MVTDRTKIPDDLIPFVSEVSIRDTFPTHTHRIVGEYRLKTASGQLGHYIARADHYELTIQADKIADAVELYQLIRQGLIHPSLSYAGVMAPSPARHVRQLLRELREVVWRDIRLRWFALTSKRKTT